MYLKQEGIDNRYSQLILRELHDATEMTNDQLNNAANELFVATPTHLKTNTQSSRFEFDSKPNV
jgi:hypothetical protein